LTDKTCSFGKTGTCCEKPAQATCESGKGCGTGQTLKAGLSCAAAACTDDDFKDDGNCCMKTPTAPQTCAAGTTSTLKCGTNFSPRPDSKGACDKAVPVTCATDKCADADFNGESRCCTANPKPACSASGLTCDTNQVLASKKDCADYTCTKAECCVAAPKPACSTATDQKCGDNEVVNGKGFCADYTCKDTDFKAGGACCVAAKKPACSTLATADQKCAENQVFNSEGLCTDYTCSKDKDLVLGKCCKAAPLPACSTGTGDLKCPADKVARTGGVCAAYTGCAAGDYTDTGGCCVTQLKCSDNKQGYSCPARSTAIADAKCDLTATTPAAGGCTAADFTATADKASVCCSAVAPQASCSGFTCPTGTKIYPSYMYQKDACTSKVEKKAIPKPMGMCAGAKCVASDSATCCYSDDCMMFANKEMQEDLKHDYDDQEKKKVSVAGAMSVSAIALTAAAFVASTFA